MRIKMKKLLMSVSFLVLLSSASMAKTEIITEEVCNSPSGCRIEMADGSCIGCVTITRTIVTEDPVVVVKEKTKSKKLIDSVELIASVDMNDRSVARCVSGCTSSRAATLGLLFEGKYWKHKTR